MFDPASCCTFDLVESDPFGSSDIQVSDDVDKPAGDLKQVVIRSALLALLFQKALSLGSIWG
jgi:hypothetical protein